MIGSISADLTKHWWIFALRGLFAILFGILALALPGLTAAVLVLFFGAYIFVSGIFAFGGVMMGTNRGQWWALLLMGVLEIIVGLYILSHPLLGALTLAYTLGIWAIAGGILQIVMGVRYRTTVSNEIYALIFGIITIAFGIYVFAFPAMGLIALALATGFYALIGGVLQEALAFRLRAAAKASPAVT